MSTQPSTTLAMVAQRAGVSVSTASRVLNRSAAMVPISEATRQRVILAAQQLGYSPSMAARALRSGSTRTLGVIGTSPEFFRLAPAAPLSHSTFVNEILFGLLEASVERGYNLTLLTGAESRASNEMELLAGFGMVDGLVVLNRDLSADELCASALRHFPKPLVYLLDYRDQDPAAAAPDDFAGGRLATRTLLERGHRRIAFVAMPGFRDIFERRRAGWAAALYDAGLDPASMPVIADLDRFDERAATALDSTAAVCANMPCAERFTAVCRAAGVGVPERIEVLAFYHEMGHPTDSMTLHREPLPPIASVAAPLARIVADGVRLLVDLIEGKPVGNSRRIYPYRLEPGMTCPPR